MRRLFLVLVLAWPLGAAADFQVGMDAYNRGDYASAMSEWRPLAERGSAPAQYMLGLMYDSGLGVANDDAKAVHWYQRAADRGDLMTEQGIAEAQYNLGLMYDAGRGVSKDRRAAFRWYRRAARQGLASAQVALGLKLANTPVRPDIVAGYAWLALADAQGHDEATRSMRALAGKMSRDQLAEAQKLSHGIARGIERGPARVVITRPTRPPQPRPPLRQAAPPRPLVTEVQKFLTYLGYKPGPADGLLGLRTASAIRAFQSDLKVTPTGKVSEELLALLQIAAAALASSNEGTREPAPRAKSSGSGFFVSTTGHVVTNRHVVEDCGRVTVNVDDANQPATVTSVDESADLALLKAPIGKSQPATFRQARRANLGEPVVVAGYPLSGLLAADLNVTTGTVSALAGIRDNPRVMQITAPVQSGNSGGPLLDKSGHVIGVVVAKLDAAKVYQVTGDLPQNINFAIKAALVRGFLDIHGVDYYTSGKDAAVGGEVVAAMARKFVVQIRCWEEEIR